MKNILKLIERINSEIGFDLSFKIEAENGILNFTLENSTNESKETFSREFSYEQINRIHNDEILIKNLINSAKDSFNHQIV